MADMPKFTVAMQNALLQFLNLLLMENCKGNQIGHGGI